MTEKERATTYAAVEPPVLPVSTRVVKRDGWYQIINPIVKAVSSNEVMLSLLAESEVDQRIDETFSSYGTLGLPFKWSIGPMSSPNELEGRLARRAEASWEFRGMAISTDIESSAANGLDVEEVTQENFDKFLDINLIGWNQKDFCQEIEEKLQRMVKHPQYRCYVVKKDSVAIGSSATILREGYGYLIGGIVLKEYRGIGAYRTMIQKRLKDLNKLGMSLATTHARETTSAPILENFGFETVFQARAYQFK